MLFTGPVQGPGPRPTKQMQQPTGIHTHKHTHTHTRTQSPQELRHSHIADVFTTLAGRFRDFQARNKAAKYQIAG